MMWRIWNSTLGCLLFRDHSSCDGLSINDALCACRCHYWVP